MCSRPSSAGDHLFHPPDKSEQPQYAPESISELAELIDYTYHGEEGGVGGHEGALEHLGDAGEGLDDGVDEGEGVLGGGFEGLCECGDGITVGVETHSTSHRAHAHAHASHAIPHAAISHTAVGTHPSI